MLAFRAAFVFTLFTLAPIMRVSAFVLPLSRYMLDAIPVGNPDGIADAPVNVKPSHPTTPDADVPAAADTSAATTDEDGASAAAAAASNAANLASTEPTDAETPDSESASPDASSEKSADVTDAPQTNGSGRVALSSATVLVGSVVAGILLSA